MNIDRKTKEWRDTFSFAMSAMASNIGSPMSQRDIRALVDTATGIADAIIAGPDYAIERNGDSVEIGEDFDKPAHLSLSSVESKELSIDDFGGDE